MQKKKEIYFSDDKTFQQNSTFDAEQLAEHQDVSGMARYTGTEQFIFEIY